MRETAMPPHSFFLLPVRRSVRYVFAMKTNRRIAPSFRLLRALGAACALALAANGCASRQEPGGPLRLVFADGLVACDVFPAGNDPVPELVLSALPIAMRTALEQIGPPPGPSRLAIRLQPPPPFHRRALARFRAEPIATQQGDDILLQPGTDPLKLAFRLGHELSHWLVERRHAARPPLWLDEGLANLVGAAAAEAAARPLSQTVVRPGSSDSGAHRHSLEELVALESYPRHPAASAAFYRQIGRASCRD